MGREESPGERQEAVDPIPRRALVLRESRYPDDARQ